ncbi:MAG TPA: hypothetical protein VEM58_01345 [Streptosporangiaceae bacterium]|nr:hypothetical protein [Streptosporangiaceae bacterium]
MSRKIIRAVSVLVATLGIPAAIFASPLSASAAQHLCESFGIYCVGAPDLSTDAPVVETLSGRDLNFLSQGNGIWKIQFNADLSQCVAAANNRIDVVIHHCNGGAGTLWKKHFMDSTHIKWESHEFPEFYLAGRNNGSQYQVEPLGVSGFFYNFFIG